MYTIDDSKISTISKYTVDIKQKAKKIVSHNHMNECHCSKLIDDIISNSNSIMNILKDIQDDD